MGEGSAAVRETLTPSAPSPGDGAAAELPRIDDLYRWAFEQAAHLRAGRFDLLDIPDVADEIEGVGKGEFRSFASGLEVILLHMLKWDHQPSRRSRSLIYPILEHRRRVRVDLDDSPSLRSRDEEALQRAYGFARLRAGTGTKLRLDVFPAACPYGWDQIMEAPYALDGG